MNGSLFLGDFHPDLESAFARRVRELCPDGDARGLRVVVPNRLLAVHLRRRTAELGVATVGLQPRALEDLVRELARPRLERDGWREVPDWAMPLVLEELVGRRAARGYFKAVAELPGLYTALAATLRDLRDGDVAPTAFAAATATRSRRRKLADLVDLVRLAGEGMQKRRLADMARLTDFAVEALGETPPSGPLLVYGVYDLLPRQRRMLLALAGGASTAVPGLCDVFFPWGEPHAFQFARPLREWFESQGLLPQMLAAEAPLPERLARLRRTLFMPPDPTQTPSAAPTPAADRSVAMLSAPHPEREALAILRVLAHDPARSALVLLRRDDDRVARLRGAARRAGLPLHVPPETLASRPAGRGALLLLELVEQGAKRPAGDGGRSAALLPRTVVEDLLGTEALSRSTFDERCRPGRWPQILRRRGIVARREDWEVLVERYATEGPQAVLPFAEGEEEDRYLDPRLRRERPALARWVQRLLREIDALAPLLRGATGAWPRAAAALADSLARWLESGPESDAVLAAARTLAELAGTVRLTPARVRNALGQALSRGLVADGERFGSAATVSSLAAARGVTADRVVLPGLVEGSFPRRAREDALLLDDEREAINAALPQGSRLPLQAAASAAEERLLFRLAIGAARQELVLSWPRGLDGGREAVPSTFVLEAARSVLGVEVDFRGLYENAAALNLDVVPLSPTHPPGAAPADLLLPSEWDLRRIDAVRARSRPAGEPAPGQAAPPERALSYLAGTYPRMAAALAADVARSQGELSAYDGLVGGGLGRAFLTTLARGEAGVRLSASRLQSYARCSFRFFLENALGAKSEPAPERFLDLGAGDMGTLYHEVLHAVFRRLVAEGALPLAAGTLPRARALLEEVLSAADLFEDEAPEPLRRARRHRMREDLGGFLVQQAQSGGAWRPRALEAEIGSGTQLAVEIGRRKLLLAGRVDRVDEGVHGTRIVDYKTGKLAKESYPDPPSLAGGRNLQLAYYERALTAERAARQLAPQPIHAAYLGVSAASGFREVAWEPRHFERARPELERVVEGIVGGIERGEFFQIENRQFCTQQCDFRVLCGPGRARTIERKAGDARAERAAEWRSGAGFPSLEEAE